MSSDAVCIGSGIYAVERWGYRGRCPYCRRSVDIRRDGFLTNHSAPTGFPTRPRGRWLHCLAA